MRMHPISVARGLPTKPTARNAALTASHDMLVSSGVRDIFLASLLADWARKAALHPVDTLTARLPERAVSNADSHASTIAGKSVSSAVVGEFGLTSFTRVVLSAVSPIHNIGRQQGAPHR